MINQAKGRDLESNTARGGRQVHVDRRNEAHLRIWKESRMEKT